MTYLPITTFTGAMTDTFDGRPVVTCKTTLATAKDITAALNNGAQLPVLLPNAAEVNYYLTALDGKSVYSLLTQGKASGFFPFSHVSQVLISPDTPTDDGDITPAEIVVNIWTSAPNAGALLAVLTEETLPVTVDTSPDVPMKILLSALNGEMVGADISGLGPNQKGLVVPQNFRKYKLEVRPDPLKAVS